MNLLLNSKLTRSCIILLMLSLFRATTAAAQLQSPAQDETAADSSAQGKSPDHRLIFLGDRGPHRPQVRADALIPVMRQRGIAIEYTDDANILASPKLAEYDGLILYANIDEITPEQEAGLLAFVEGGKGFVPLHCASFCFRNSEKFVDLVGAQFRRHEAEVFSTRLTPQDQPVFEGFGGFESWDETYIHHRHNERDRIVLEYRDQGPQARGSTSEPWTWIRQQGKGRVFYTAWGHDLRTWNNPGFQNLVERGIRWACGGDPGLVPAFERPQADSQPEPEREPQQSSQRFEPPRMVNGSGKLEYLEYDDVGPKIPQYAPSDRGSRRRGAGHEHHSMQRPLSPEVSQTYYVTPEGFSLQLFTAEPDIAGKPISMNWDARGRLWVCESVDYPNDLDKNGRGNDRIRICEDTDGDGKADKFTVFAEELSIPAAIAFYRGGAIVQNATETIFLKDVDGDDRADERKTLISGWAMHDTHGGVSNFQYGLDNWIWAMQGYNPSSPRYVDAAGNEHEVPTFRQGFFRFRLDQSDPPRVVDIEFLRSTNNNTWGLGISEEGLVFGSTANGNPSVFMPIPNRYYERVQGWSANTLRMIADTARFSPVTDKVRQVDNFGAYTAGAGHALYTARTYPRQWWNRTAFVSCPTGHLVGVFMLERDGAGYRSTSPTNLVASRDEWSAPIMAEVGPDGNVWIIDWYNYIVQHNPTPYGFTTGKGAAYESNLRDKKHGRIYRLKYDGADPSTAAPRSLDAATPAELVAALRHPTKLWRLHAQRMLVERGQLDVAPELIAMMKDNSVDPIGLNVGAIHAIGVLRGLGAFDENGLPAAIDSLHAALAHPSAGVRRNAILALPVNEISREKLLATSALRDADAQVQLAAILALSDLPPSRDGAEAIATLLMDEVASDPWISDAISSAAAMNGVDFVEALAWQLPRSSSGERELSREVANVADIVGEHIARSGLDASQLAALLEALASADGRLAPTVLASLSRFWPDDRFVQLPPSSDRAMESLLADAPMDTKSDLLRLAQLWKVGNTDELQRQHSASLRVIVENADLTDDERIAAAQALVRIDVESGAAGRDILRMISPQTSLPLLTGLLRAVSESRYEGFTEELLDLYGNLLPQGRQAVVEVLLEQADSTNALLNAIAAGKFDVAGLSLEQMAALRAHPIQAIRTRADELLLKQGASPDPDRQEALAELLPMAEAAGNAERGKQLFAKHCAVCHMHGGVGETIAPDLTGMFVHPKKHILENIIDPSRDVETNFRSYSIISNGKVYVGMYAGESRTTVTMVDSTGRRHVIQRGEIEEVYSSTKSLMPDGFEKVLSQSDLADVLEFLATRQRYVPLRLAGVATTSSADSPFGRGFGRRGDDRNGRGTRDGRSGDGAAGRRDRREGREGRDRRDGRDGGFLALTDWKPTTVGGVPFSLVDPQQGAVKNVLLFGGESSRFARDLPGSVRLPCGLPAKTIHLLSGVSLGGFPFHPDKSTSLVVKFHYEDGQTEDHELKNGVHFANYREREDVPESEFAFRMGDQQMRYLTIEPKRTDALIADIEFIKADDPTLPIVLAVTAELP